MLFDMVFPEPTFSKLHGEKTRAASKHVFRTGTKSLNAMNNQPL
jgi:hypothetical protein